MSQSLSEIIPSSVTNPPNDSSIDPTFFYTSRDTTAASKISISKPSKKPSCSKLLPTCDTQGYVGKNIQLRPIQNQRIIIDVSTLETIFEKSFECKFCHHGPVKLFETSARYGFGILLYLRCEFCHTTTKYWSVSGRFSEKLSVGNLTVPKRNDSTYQVVLGARMAGIGKMGLDYIFCTLGIGRTLTYKNYSCVTRDLLVTLEHIAINSMQKAVDELRKSKRLTPEDFVYIIGSYDGAYQKRSSKMGGGFSRYCFASLIDMETGKVVAYNVACNSCPRCTELRHKLRDGILTAEEHRNQFEVHMNTCPAKYRDFSSVSLESEICPEIVTQGYKRGIICDGLVCDGDNKSFEKIINVDPYGKFGLKHYIKRFECLSHCVKRMKGHLIEYQKEKLRLVRREKAAKVKSGIHKNIVEKEYKGKLVRKNIERGDWSHSSKNAFEIKFLTDAFCSRIASMYQLAVKHHVGCVDLILQSIRAIPFHYSATDETAADDHSKCPQGAKSWCKYQAAIARGVISPKHPNYLGPEAVNLVLEVFDKFNYDKPFFIEQIAEGLTSNHNEALHNVLFTMVPKTDAISYDTMCLGSALAVIRYNGGLGDVLPVFEFLGIHDVAAITELFRELDEKRVIKSYSIPAKQSKRFMDRQSRGRKVTEQKQKHGIGYESGKFSGSAVRSDVETLEEMESHGQILFSEPSLPIPNLERQSCGVCDGEEPGRDEDTSEMTYDMLNWVGCDECSRWYHFACVNIQDKRDLSDIWLCNECLD